MSIIPSGPGARSTARYRPSVTAGDRGKGREKGQGLGQRGGEGRMELSDRRAVNTACAFS
jgi:hypothetical protein